MPVDTSFNPDFGDPKLCAFLNSDYATLTFSDGDSAAEQWIQLGYQKESSKPALASPEKIFLQTYEITTFDVRTPDDHPLYLVDVADAVEHRLLMQIVAILLLKTGLDAEKSKAAKDAFDNGDPNQAAEIESELIRNGLQSDDYVVCLSMSLTQGAPPVVTQTNRQAFIGQVSNQTDSKGQKLYRVERKSNSRNCDQPPNADSDDNVVICDPDRPEDCLKKKANSDHPDCDGLVLTPLRIGTAYQYDEWRTISKKKKIKIGRCWTWMWVPVVESRLTKQALWGSVASKDNIKKYFERSLKECLETAAISTAVLVLVTEGGGLSAAVQVFITSVMKCLESKLEQAVTCLFVNLDLVKEQGDWQEKWW
jgi:hypothetical protein